MRTRASHRIAVLAILFMGGVMASQTDAAPNEKDGPGKKKPKSVFDLSVKDMDGKNVDLSKFRGQVLMVVNVASQWGLTDQQYSSLESLHKKYKDKGLRVLAFPANNFGNQEPGTNKEIAKFCSGKGVTFPVFAKVSTTGKDQHPLYKFLTDKKTSGKFAGPVKWNFQKFLVSRKGQVIGRFEPKTDPLDEKCTGAVKKALKEPGGKNNSKGDKSKKAKKAK